MASVPSMRMPRALRKTLTADMAQPCQQTVSCSAPTAENVHTITRHAQTHPNAQVHHTSHKTHNTHHEHKLRENGKRREEKRKRRGEEEKMMGEKNEKKTRNGKGGRKQREK